MHYVPIALIKSTSTPFFLFHPRRKIIRNKKISIARLIITHIHTTDSRPGDLNQKGIRGTNYDYQR
jgi:intergrase/recombinase